MGAGASKEELVYSAVQRGDLSGIRALRQQGCSLEYRDAKGRTPLMLACSRPDCFEAAHTLLQLGADIRAYSKGVEGGTPIHFAARKKLTRTLEMLLNYGADPLLRNDMGKSALDLAREQHLTAMVRLIEGRVGLFSGLMRQQLLSNAIVKMLLPQWVSRIVWVSVLPFNLGSPSLQVAIYPSGEAGMPHTVLMLAEHVVSLSKQDTTDPKCVIQSKTGEKFKFSSEPPDQPAMVYQFYNACLGVNQIAVPPRTYPAAGAVHPQHPGYVVPPPGYPAAYPPAPPYTPPPQPSPGAPPGKAAAAGSAAARPGAGPGAGAGPEAGAGAGGGAAVGGKGAGKGSQGSGQGSFGSSLSTEHLKRFQGADIDEDAALKLAIEESMKTASAGQAGGAPGGASAASYNGWGAAPAAAAAAPQPSFGGWADPAPAPSSPAPPARGGLSTTPGPPARALATPTPTAPASAASPSAAGGPPRGPPAGAPAAPAAANAAPSAPGNPLAYPAVGTTQLYGGWGAPSRPAAGAPPAAGASRPTPLGPGPAQAPAYAVLPAYSMGLGRSAGAAPAPAAAAAAPAQPTSAARAAAGAGAGRAPGPSTGPSAPPPPPGAVAGGGGGMYPLIDLTPVNIDYNAVEAVATPVPPQAPAPPLVNPAYSEERVREELRKAEEKRGEGQCVICWDAPANGVCIPCGHIAGCMECLTEMKGRDWACVVCRAKIDNVIKVFHV